MSIVAVETSINPTFSPPQNLSRKIHIPALDGIRALAILMVMVFHFFQHAPVQTNSILKIIAKIAALGQTGVDLFFVLSGFLITGILLDTRLKQHALRIFYLRRTFRIFPLYYAYLVAAFVLLPALHLAAPVAWSNQWWFWVYCQNIQDTFVRNFTMFGPGHFWSLAVEEHFYLIWPFVVISLPLHRLKQVLIGLIGLAIVIRTAMVLAGYPVFYFTLSRMDTLAFGALLAVLSREGNFLSAAGRWIRKRIVWCLVALAPMYVLSSGASNPLVQVVKYSIFALLYTCVVAWALTVAQKKMAARVLGSPAASALAKGSYAMYVFHPAIFGLVQDRLPFLPTLAALAVAFVLTFAAAWLSWNLLDHPCLKLRDWLQHRSARKALIPAVT